MAQAVITSRRGPLAIVDRNSKGLVKVYMSNDSAQAARYAATAQAAAGDSESARKKSQFAIPFGTRAALTSAAGAVDGLPATVTDPTGSHTAVSGEVALGNGAATVGALIPDMGKYTRISGAWLRTGDLDSQTASLAATTANNAAASATSSLSAAVLRNNIMSHDAIGYASLSPASTWNGTAGTGFSSTPVDPTRTTAKPAVRLTVVPNQSFTDYIVVGLQAWANNTGDLHNCGLKSVKFYYEGKTVTVDKPTFYSFQDVNGKFVTYLGFWVALLHNGINGDANLYAEATPKDATMQNRVIGPYTFFPSASLYDIELTVAPSSSVITGSRYQSIAAALTYAASQSKNRPHITITEARTDYLLGAMTGPFSYATGKGFATIDATVPVTIIGTTSFVASTPRTKYSGMRFRGSNITLDMKFMDTIYCESTGLPHWFDGVTITQSGGRNYIVPELLAPHTNGITNVGGYFTECTITNIPNTLMQSKLVRGCTVTGGYADAVSESLCLLNNRFDDWDSSYWTTYRMAFTVTYTGTGTTATLELSGVGYNNSRTLTAKVDGTSVGTFAVGRTSGATMTTVVAWLNGLTGWSATLQDASLHPALLSIAGGIGGPFTAQNVKSTTLQLYTYFDLHADWYQQNSPANVQENVIAFGNICSNIDGQMMFLSSVSPTNDFFFLNNCWSLKNQSLTFYSQLGRAGAKSHVVIVHNSSTQQLWLRPAAGWNADAYCLIANNVLLSIVWDGTPDTDISISNNHYLTGATVPSGDVGGTVGGTVTTAWQSVSTGDFSPRGSLLTNLKTRIMRRDGQGQHRSRVDVAGAYV